MNVLSLVQSNIRELTAYHVQEVEQSIKLDAMECPWSWPQALLEDWQKGLAEVAINRYPDPRAPQLRACLRDVFSLPDSASMMLGNGSDELLQMLVFALAKSGSKVLAPVPCFSMYEHLSRAWNMEFIGVPLQAHDFSLDMPAMLHAIEQHQPRIVFLACPNNPTGNLFSSAEISTLIAAAPGVVVLDEAYSPYASHFNSLSYLAEEKVIIMRTLSKVGLAGLRLGYMLGTPDLFSEIEKIRLPYNINVLTQYSVEFALRHFSYFQDYVQCILAERQKMLEFLQGFAQLQVWASQTNFLTFRCPDADALFNHLKHQDILLKNLSHQHPILHNCLRLSIGSPQENQHVRAAVQEFYA